MDAQPVSDGTVESERRSAVADLRRQLHTVKTPKEAAKIVAATDLETLRELAGQNGGAANEKASATELLQRNLELEKQVQDRTAQLEAISKELEAFSYSVSHDLRAPLRSVRGFADVLLERHAQQLDERGLEFLRRVTNSSHHLDSMIEDLVKLSRIGRSPMNSAKVDLTAIAKTIETDLRKHDPARRVELVIAPGLQAQGDETLLRALLDHLLRNAWKFTSKKDAARIEFGAVKEPQIVYFVKDNGTGFDMAYANKLFGVFQRLHTTGEFPGAGIGLAIARRVVNRHGGRIWAEAKAGEGATFFFTLPSGEEQP